MRSEKLRNEVEVLRLVWHHTKGQHLKLSLAMLLELLIGLFPPLAIYFLQKVVGLQATHLEALLTRSNILLLLLLYFIYIVLTKLSRILTAYAVAEVEYSLRVEFLHALSGMSYAEMTEHVGLQASNGLVQEIAMASGLVPMVYRSFIRAGVTILAFCALLLWISPGYFAVVLVLTCAILLSVVILRSRIKRIHKDLYTRISSIFQLFGEWIGGYRVFRVFGCMDFAVSRMQEAFQTIRKLSRRLALVSNSQSILAEVLTYSVAAIIIVMMPTQGEILNLGVLISFPTAILFIRSEAMVFIYGYQQLANTESSIRRLFGIISHKNSEETEHASEVGEVQGISLEHVCFAHTSERAESIILKDATLQLPRGRLHVLTGPSGTGKTTTLNLLMGLLQPQAGQIQLQEATGDETDKRKGIALVEQEPFFFDGSLYDNICLGRSDIRTADIMPYLDILHLTHLFPTEESLMTPVEKLGRKLSTGEKQRLALVRALVGRPAVLFVDEVTSNVDHETSELIADYLRQQAREILVVAVSHDPILMQRADEIHQLKDNTYLK